jgi:hypothetical protein
MTSTHIFPQSYKINHIRYDPAPISEGNFGKVYKGRDLDVCVNMVTKPSDVSVRFAHTSHISVTVNTVPLCRKLLKISPSMLTRFTRTSYHSMEYFMKLPMKPRGFALYHLT